MARDVIEMEVLPGFLSGPISLGMTQSEVLERLGEPEAKHGDWLGVGGTWYWYESCVQISFGRSGTVGEIQLCSRGPVRAIVYGLDVLNTDADVVVASLAERAPGEEAENGYAFDFPSLRLAFWRECLPGAYPDDDPQLRGGRFWDTVSTWSDDYHQEIEEAAGALPPP